MSGAMSLLRGITRPLPALSHLRTLPSARMSHTRLARMSSTTNATAAAPQFLPHNFEVIVAQPSTSASRSATIQKFRAGLAIQQEHPDFVGVPVEGVCLEDGRKTLRVLEWTSFDGHMKRFRGGPSYAKFVEVRKGAYDGEPHMRHYNFTSPVPSAPVIEYMMLPLLDASHFPAFHAAFSKALAEYVCPTRGFMGLALGQQTEDPSKVLCLFGWERLEDHTVGFRQSEVYERWKVVVDLILQSFVEGGRAGMEMWHVESCEPGAGVGKEQ